ncbi:MAG: EAL domain-containing protein, partial [Ruminococcus sp.]|nr:EAL domain-containing protein [Ruminococcus sp.]
MDQEKEYRFFRLYEQLASLTQIVNQKPEIPKIEAIMNEISVMLRLAKGVTHFYKNPGDEQRGIGETMCSYDIGAENIKPVHTVRFVTNLMSISTMTIYMTEDEEPLTDEELFKADLTMRTTLAFISRNRLQIIAEELAFFDDMGFRNIRSFFKFLAWNNKPGDFNGMAAIQYNLRHFALVNEEHGRAGGDMVLKNHYQHIETVIGKGGMVSRLGGDTFVCVCKQNDLPELLDYLNDAAVLANPNGKTANISACAGVFQIPDGYTVSVPNDIMGKIMQSYQIAKVGAQGNIVFYSDMMLSEKERARKIQKMLPEALQNGEFHVFYQPKVNIITGELCGAEALCRWFHDGQIVPPIEFIPVLEETSDICRLDFHMLEQVCKHIRKWLDAGKKPGRISVNLSRRHMTNAQLVDIII